MALITLSIEELETMSGVAKKDMEEVLTRLGVPVERMEGGEIDLEITPNRPDMLCVEGVSRAMKAFSTGKNAFYKAEKSDYRVLVEKSVLNVRPFIAVAVVKEVKISDDFLKSLINLQEKLHDTIGRKRRKVAIGVHDASRIAFPLTYKAVSPDWEGFVPLDMKEKMSPERILREHKTGIEFAHLVQGNCPMILDSKGQVLSFPPVINGNLTRVTTDTQDVILDVTGTSKETVGIVLNMLACVFADRGGKVYAVKIGTETFPDFAPKSFAYPKEFVKKLLGLALTKPVQAKYLAMMGYAASGEKVFVPPYRADIIHQVDIVEDIAIAHGLNNFKQTVPAFFTNGSEIKKPPVHRIMTGMGFLECSSWILTSAKKLENAGVNPSSALEIKNKLTEDFAYVRPETLPNLLAILASSKDEKMPQKIYEVGPVWAQSQGCTIDTLACAITHPKASFSEAKSVIKTIFFELGEQFSIKEGKNKAYIEGRCALITAGGKPIGFFGEIHPQVLNNFGIEQPVCAFEIRLDWIKA